MTSLHEQRMLELEEAIEAYIRAIRRTGRASKWDVDAEKAKEKAARAVYLRKMEFACRPVITPPRSSSGTSP